MLFQLPMVSVSQLQDWFHCKLHSRTVTAFLRYPVRLRPPRTAQDYYEQRLGREITKQMAMWVKEGDADAVLYLNDYDILTGNQLDKYVTHIETLLEQGVPLGGIGVQGHLHGDSWRAWMFG